MQYFLGLGNDCRHAVGFPTLPFRISEAAEAQDHAFLHIGDPRASESKSGLWRSAARRVGSSLDVGAKLQLPYKALLQVGYLSGDTGWDDGDRT